MNREAATLLRQGDKQQWLDFRRGNDDQILNLRGADLHNVVLRDWPLANVDLTGADLEGADLTGANLSQSVLSKSRLNKTKFVLSNLADATIAETLLIEADFSSANLTRASFYDSNVKSTCFRDADLESAFLYRTNLIQSDLSGTVLVKATLIEATLIESSLRGADLSKSDLTHARLVNVDVTEAVIVEAQVYGISAWAMKGICKLQKGLVVTEPSSPIVTVENIEMAQFIHMIITNSKIREFLDTMTSKLVLVLGRFSSDRKRTLDAIKEELSRRDYVAVIFDFPEVISQSLAGTVRTLASLSHFVIADISEARSVCAEIGEIVHSSTVPIQPLIQAPEKPYALLPSRVDFPGMLDTIEYDSRDQLLEALVKEVIQPAEARAQELAALRAHERESGRTTRKLSSSSPR